MDRFINNILSTNPPKIKGIKSDEYSINHASVYFLSPPDYPPDYKTSYQAAEEINPFVTQIIKAGGSEFYGIVVCDFYTKEFIKTIIESNKLSPRSYAVPLYDFRLNADHFYTTSLTDHPPNYANEQIVAYVFEHGLKNTVPLRRLEKDKEKKKS